MQVSLANAVTVNNGKPVTTSLKVAEVFGKQHRNVLQTIHNLEVPEEFRKLNFQQTVYERPNPSGGNPIQYPMFYITRDGFTLLAMGFTGKAAMQFKLAYIEAFNAMEKELAKPRKEKAVCCRAYRVRLPRRAEVCAMVADLTTRIHALEQIVTTELCPDDIAGLSFPSSVQEVENFCKAERLSFVNPARFFNYYEANHWMIDGIAIENWRTVCRSWNMTNMRRSMLPSGN